MGRGRERERGIKVLLATLSVPHCTLMRSGFRLNSPSGAVAEATGACTTRREAEHADGTFSPGNRKKLHHLFKLRWSKAVMPSHANEQVEVFFPFWMIFSLSHLLMTNSSGENPLLLHNPFATRHWMAAKLDSDASLFLLVLIALSCHFMESGRLWKRAAGSVFVGQVADGPHEDDGQLPRLVWRRLTVIGEPWNGTVPCFGLHGQQQLEPALWSVLHLEQSGQFLLDPGGPQYRWQRTGSRKRQLLIDTDVSVHVWRCVYWCSESQRPVIASYVVTFVHCLLSLSLWCVRGLHK